MIVDGVQLFTQLCSNKGEKKTVLLSFLVNISHETLRCYHIYIPTGEHKIRKVSVCDVLEGHQNEANIFCLSYSFFTCALSFCFSPQSL